MYICNWVSSCRVRTSLLFPLSHWALLIRFILLSYRLYRLYIYIYIYIYTRSICIQQLFRSLRAHQYCSDQKKILKDQSAQLNKVKERNIRSICIQQLFHSLRAHQHSSDQKKILKDHSAQTTARAVSVAYTYIYIYYTYILRIYYIYIYIYICIYICNKCWYIWHKSSIR